MRLDYRLDYLKHLKPFYLNTNLCKYFEIKRKGFRFDYRNQ
jgi:hypothetical protein